MIEFVHIYRMYVDLVLNCARFCCVRFVFSIVCIVVNLALTKVAA